MSPLICKPDNNKPAFEQISHDTVLFCLSKTERHLFFPDNGIGNLPGKCLHFDTTKCSINEWREALFSTQPTVLVSCWSTPMLPSDYVEDPSLKLKYVCHLVGSVRTVVPRSLLLRGVSVTNWGRIASVSVAEHALLLILSALRRMPRWRGGLLAPLDQQANCRIAMGTRSLSGQRVGLHGFGGVAQHLTKLLRPFDVTISAYSAGVPSSLMAEQGVHPCESLEELFSMNAILVECEALTPRTKDTVNEKILNLLPQDTVFVNVGRGKVVNEGALIQLARAGRIRLALDVYYNEPLPLSHNSPLLALPDVILSPHIAGPTYDLNPKCARLAEANLQRFFQGKPLEEPITIDQYDRST